MKSPDKIIVVDRFRPLRMHLLTLLAGLGEEDWGRATAAPLWSVKDLTAHLLGGDVWISLRSVTDFVCPRPSRATSNSSNRWTG